MSASTSVEPGCATTVGHRKDPAAGSRDTSSRLTMRQACGRACMAGRQASGAARCSAPRTCPPRPRPPAPLFFSAGSFSASACVKLPGRLLTTSFSAKVAPPPTATTSAAPAQSSVRARTPSPESSAARDERTQARAAALGSGVAKRRCSAAQVQAGGSAAGALPQAAGRRTGVHQDGGIVNHNRQVELAQHVGGEGDALCMGQRRGAWSGGAGPTAAGAPTAGAPLPTARSPGAALTLQNNLAHAILQRLQGAGGKRWFTGRPAGTRSRRSGSNPISPMLTCSNSVAVLTVMKPGLRGPKGSPGGGVKDGGCAAAAPSSRAAQAAVSQQRANSIAADCARPLS